MSLTYHNKRFSIITVPVATTRTFRVYGKSFKNVTNVYLSGAPYTQARTQNPFAYTPRLSALYPSFAAIKLLSSDYTVSEEGNYLVFTMPSATTSGVVDVIVENPAGYGSLMTYVVKELYGTQQTNAQLRPWSTGINVGNPLNLELSAAPSNQVYTINNDILVTISGDSIVTI